MNTIHSVILDKIVARLGEIKTSNGYSKNVIPKVISEQVKTPFTSYDLPRIVVYGGADSLQETSYGDELRTFNVVIQIYTILSEGNFVRTAYEFGAAVHTAVTRSVFTPLVSDTPELTLDDTVYSISVDNISPIAGDEESLQYCGAEISVSVKYPGSYSGYI